MSVTEIKEQIRYVEKQLVNQFEAPKLGFCIIPRPCKGSNLRSLLPKEQWDEIRRSNYKRACYVCEICKTRRASPLHCHEEWRFNIETEMQELVNLVVLCELCHAVKHWNSKIAKKIDIVAHVVRMNRWSDRQLHTYLRLQSVLYELRNFVQWGLSIAYAFEYDLSPDYDEEPEHRRQNKEIQIDFGRLK